MATRLFETVGAIPFYLIPCPKHGEPCNRKKCRMTKAFLDALLLAFKDAPVGLVGRLAIQVEQKSWRELVKETKRK